MYACSSKLGSPHIVLAMYYNSLLCINFAENVEIFFDQTAYSIFENPRVVTVTVKLSDTYNEDIVVNVAVGELEGRYI